MEKSATLSKFTLDSNASVTSTGAKSFADEIHAAELRETFGKASNIIREPIEVEGVAFLDAMVNTFGGLVPSNPGSDTTETTGSESQHDKSCSDGREADNEGPEQKYCKILGFSTSDASSIDDKPMGSSQLNIPQKLLRGLLRRYPAGKTFMFDSEGEVVSGDSDKDRIHAFDAGATEAQASAQERKRIFTHSRQSESTTLAAVLKGPAA
jgi:hypothetical protein